MTGKETNTRDETAFCASPSQGGAGNLQAALGSNSALQRHSLARCGIPARATHPFTAPELQERAQGPPPPRPTKQAINKLPTHNPQARRDPPTHSPRSPTCLHATDPLPTPIPAPLPHVSVIPNHADCRAPSAHNMGTAACILLKEMTEIRESVRETLFRRSNTTSAAGRGVLCGERNLQLVSELWSQADAHIA